MPGQHPRSRFGILLVLLLGLCSGLPDAYAQESAPRFPQSKIGKAQWDQFLAEVKAKPGAQDVSRPERPDIEAIAVEREGTMYYFTRSGAAHPAVVIAQVATRDGAMFLRHSGYYAGDEQAFARLFKGYTEGADKMRRSLEGQGGTPRR